ARARGLQVADKRDSQEICFVRDGDYGAVVQRYAGGGTREGEIVNRQGRVLGTHGGIHRFTVGQRKGLNLAAGVPLYVLGISADSGRVVVGPREALDRDACSVSAVNWIAGAPPAAPRRLRVQIRSRHAAAPALVTPRAGAAEVLFDEPQAAITPGQAAVFYDGDEVIGGGWIGNQEGEDVEGRT
ncbi:MAG TPA: aminomethyltransferase beta-barrel domain-containing protein, partial [Vicinamibacterales bacterium]|nr:aminomethyltransferase beta-barrel domain-containing protein [Vicinamibacterales bacterium]